MSAGSVQKRAHLDMNTFCLKDQPQSFDISRPSRVEEIRACAQRRLSLIIHNHPLSVRPANVHSAVLIDPDRPGGSPFLSAVKCDQVTLQCQILHDAFSPQAAVGGGLGSAILTGVKRGLFSNEAGEGSVPNAAATADVSHPIKQGLIQAFGVYVDTWLVCSATAFIVLLTGQYTIGGELTGIALAQASLASIFGASAPAAVSFMILMFAFSSIVGNYYYGEINIAFFEAKGKMGLFLFRALVIGMVVFGSMAELSLVWNLADLFMGLLCLTNLYAISRLYKYAKVTFSSYLEQKRQGIAEPVFDPAILPDEHGIHAWGVDKD